MVKPPSSLQILKKIGAALAALAPLVIALIVICSINAVLASDIISHGHKDVYLDYEYSNDWLAIQAIADVSGLEEVTIADPSKEVYVGQAISFAIYYDNARQVPGTPIILTPATQDHRIRVRVSLTPSPIEYYAADGYDNAQESTPNDPLKTALDYLLYLAGILVEVPIPPIPWGLLESSEPRITEVVDSDKQGFTFNYNYNPSLQGVQYVWKVYPSPDSGRVEQGYYWINAYAEASAGYYAAGVFYHDESISIWLSSGFYVVYSGRE